MVSSPPALRPCSLFPAAGPSCLRRKRPY